MRPPHHGGARSQAVDLRDITRYLNIHFYRFNNKIILLTWRMRIKAQHGQDHLNFLGPL